MAQVQVRGWEPVLLTCELEPYLHLNEQHLLLRKTLYLQNRIHIGHHGAHILNVVKTIHSETQYSMNETEQVGVDKYFMKCNRTTTVCLIIAALYTYAIAPG